MRTETVTRTLYTFTELDESAKENARDVMRQDPHLWGWESEWHDSRAAFERIAPVEAIRWNFGAAHVDARWTDDDEVGDLSGVRAWKWLANNGPDGPCTALESGCSGSKGRGRTGRYRLHQLRPSWLDVARENAPGGCTLTGFCGDCPLFDPIAKIADRPGDVPELRDLFADCLYRWALEAGRDYAHAYSDEGIDEMIEANGYEWTESGRLAD